ncbi:MAG: hypothetical protein Q4F06_07330 [Eubacteriales bacterium]|nr:hypothetical protein [Eubacteriales bacterium]
MKKFSRCILILILTAVVSGICGFIYENQTITPMYESVTQLYVVPGEENEASIRANNGGLKDDFTIIFQSDVVISAAQKIAGTSENIAKYLTVTSPANSNIVEIRCVNPDQNTAKTYVDAVAKTAIKTTTIIPVKSIQILSEGTSSGVSFKPGLAENTLVITAVACGICVFVELIVCLFLSAFKTKDDDFNHELEYERRFGKYSYAEANQGFIGASSITSKKDRDFIEGKTKAVKQDDDILASFDDDYGNDDDADYVSEAEFKEGIDSVKENDIPEENVKPESLASEIVSDIKSDFNLEKVLSENVAELQIEPGTDNNTDVLVEDVTKEVAATKESKVKILGRIRK